MLFAIWLMVAVEVWFLIDTSRTLRAMIHVVRAQDLIASHRYSVLKNKLNQVIRRLPPISQRIIFYIDGERKTDMTTLNADKNYSIVLKGQDQDGNDVAIADAVTMELSDAALGDIVKNDDGSFVLNPKKVGQGQLIAKAGALVGTLDIEVQPGALFQISVAVQEKA